MLGFRSQNLTDWVGYGLAIGAILVSLVAIILTWYWRRDDHGLLAETKVIVEALGPAVQGIEAQVQELRSAQRTTNAAVSSLQQARGLGQFSSAVRAEARSAPSPAAISAREVRRQQSLALKAQKFRWQQTKDLAKAVRWVLDKLDSGDDEE